MKEWYNYVDENLTSETLTKVTQEFLDVIAKAPEQMKKHLKLSNVPNHISRPLGGGTHQQRALSECLHGIARSSNYDSQFTVETYCFSDGRCLFKQP